MTPAHCFLLTLEVIKWLSEKNQSSDRCIYLQPPLSVPSLKLFLERNSIDTMSQDSSDLYRCGSCFEHWEARLNVDQWHPINIWTVKICLFLLCCLQTSWSLHNISISRIYRPLATHQYLSGVWTLRRIMYATCLQRFCTIALYV